MTGPVTCPFRTSRGDGFRGAGGKGSGGALTDLESG
jgi:hypothetical protein